LFNIDLRREYIQAPLAALPRSLPSQEGLSLGVQVLFDEGQVLPFL
jgi:hypothetical protein